MHTHFKLNKSKFGQLAISLSWARVQLWSLACHCKGSIYLWEQNEEVSGKEVVVFSNVQSSHDQRFAYQPIHS